MFGILKTIVWIVGALVVASFVLNYFGYALNMDYFKESRAKCQEEVKNCTQNLIRQGTDNVNCDFTCINPKLIIKKK
jgi:hypothetical protein